MKVHTITLDRKITLRQTNDLDDNRLRFNWGYHDGANDFKAHSERIDHADHNTILDTHYDTVYARGYHIGYHIAENGLYDGNSNAAWLDAINVGDVKPGITDYNARQWRKLIS